MPHKTIRFSMNPVVDVKLVPTIWADHLDASHSRSASLALSELVDAVAAFDLGDFAIRQLDVVAASTRATTRKAGDNADEVLADVPHARLRCLMRDERPTLEIPPKSNVEVPQKLACELWGAYSNSIPCCVDGHRMTVRSAGSRSKKTTDHPRRPHAPSAAAWATTWFAATITTSPRGRSISPVRGRVRVRLDGQAYAQAEGARSACSTGAASCSPTVRRRVRRASRSSWLAPLGQHRPHRARAHTTR
jgi:hypothetical protein